MGVHGLLLVSFPRFLLVEIAHKTAASSFPIDNTHVFIIDVPLDVGRLIILRGGRAARKKPSRPPSLTLQHYPVARLVWA